MIYKKLMNLFDLEIIFLLIYQLSFSFDCKDEQTIIYDKIA